MSKSVLLDRNILVLSLIAASTTIIAGILHLTMVQRSISHNPGEGILFLVGGILQIFWAVPVIKRWAEYGKLLEL